MNITEKTSEINYLAAMAVFQQLFDEQKNVQDVICSFIKYYIVSTRIYDFLLEEIYNGINSFYNFKLPIAIVKSSLRKLKDIISKNSEGHYLFDSAKLPADMGTNIFAENKNINDKMIVELEKYVSEKIKRELNENEKKELFDGLCNFLVGDKVDYQFQKHISSFVLEKSKDETIKKQLDDISEGLIIYTGITSELDPSKVGSWKYEMNLYLDMEILFHIVGYNGDFFKKQADDFLSLIREINKKEKIIKLFYFDKVKREIEHFFNTAENIVAGKAIGNGTVAMGVVTKGKLSSSEIITEKAKFYSKLTKLDINCDEMNYFDNEENNQYCIQSDFDPMLSMINMLRKGDSNKPIQNIKYLLITGTRSTLGQAYSLVKPDTGVEQIKNDSYDTEEKYTQKPLAKSLEDITKLFWFALNKNFGHSYKLTSFDVVHKAKVVLASILNGKIKENYSKLNKDFLKGDLTKEAVANCIDELRNKTRLPEQIESENVDFVLNLIESADIENIQNEKALKENLLKEKTEENDRLQNSVERKDAEIAALKKQIEERNIQDKDKEIERIKKQKKAQIILLFVIKVICIFIVIATIVFSLNKWIIPLIKGDNKWITLGSLILSIIGGIGAIIALINKCLLKPFKDKLEKINNFEVISKGMLK